MVQSPSWEANRFAASQEIPRISRNLKVHYLHSQASTTCLYLYNNNNNKKKKKKKFTLEQATKAQKGSGGIVLLFL